MKVIGIDPGLAILGWCCLDSSSLGEKSLRYGVIETPAHQTLSRRLHIIYQELNELFDLHKPDVLSLETLFFVKNAKTLAQVGHSRGVILLVAEQRGVPVYEYAPRQIKMALTGYGGADKGQMQRMVQRLLNLPSIPSPDDAADATAVALCHVQFRPSVGQSAVTV